MPSREIPKAEWEQFFNEFSRRHEGRFVTIQLAGADFTLATLAEKVPFKRITADLRDDISVMTGAKPFYGLSHGEFFRNNCAI